MNRLLFKLPIIVIGSLFLMPLHPSLHDAYTIQQVSGTARQPHGPVFLAAQVGFIPLASLAGKGQFKITPYKVTETTIEDMHAKYLTRINELLARAQCLCISEGEHQEQLKEIILNLRVLLAAPLHTEQEKPSLNEQLDALRKLELSINYYAEAVTKFNEIKKKE